MKCKLIIFLTVFLMPAFLFSMEKAESTANKKLHFFSGLFSNLGDCFTGTNIFFWAGVPASTVLLVNAGQDDAINTYFQQNRVWSRSTDMIFLQAGNFAQALPHASMFLYGYFGNKHELAAAGAAGLQAMGINGGIVITLKWASGRGKPSYDTSLNKTPHDKEFNFNIAEQSVYSDRWRWPSGHTSSTFAVVSSFYGFYNDKTYIAILGYPLATLMGFAMIQGQYHWATDVVAGALIGHVVGYTTGKNFRRMYEGASSQAKSGKKKNLEWVFAPRLLENGLGFAFTSVY